MSRAVTLAFLFLILITLSLMTSLIWEQEKVIRGIVTFDQKQIDFDQKTTDILKQ